MNDPAPRARGIKRIIIPLENLRFSNFPFKVPLWQDHRELQNRKLHQGIDFLGFVVLPHATTLRTKTKKRMFRKLKSRVKLYKQGHIDEAILLQSINSYLGLLSHGNFFKLRGALKQAIWEWLNDPNL